jgi:hypothetical protein
MPQMDQVLAQLRPAERARLERHLDEASKGLWHVRRALIGHVGPELSLDEWHAYLRTIADALAAVGSLVPAR